MSTELLGVIGVIVMLVLIFAGVHVAIANGAVGFIGLVLTTNMQAAVLQAANIFFHTSSDYSLTVLPLFIIMGFFAGASAVSRGAFDFAFKWLGNFPAGLYLVTIGACGLLAAATGSTFTGTVAVGKSILPEMERYHYDRKLSVGCIACAGTLGVLIPPSIPFVIYGIATQESIGELLIAGIMPGILTIVVYMIGITILVRLRPELGQKAVKFTWRERFRALPGVWGVTVLFGVVMGGLYSGVFTPTEAGAIGAFASMIMLVIDRKGDSFREIRKGAAEAMMSGAMIFFILVTSVVLTRFLTVAGTVDVLTDFIEGGLSPWVIVAVIILVSIIFGMILSATAALLLIAPIAHTVLTSAGFDGIWLGVILVKMFMLAGLTPPVALNVYVAKSLVPDMSLEDVFKGAMVWAALDLVSTIILIIFPIISTWLPSLYAKT
ncbi:MAG: TRAP transporter large permease [Chloroflexi bacterium]|nr:TRAP transporter large permease [Chloroflexota bacterium]